MLPERAAIPFGELKIDALLVSAPPNVRYLSGFTGDNGLLLVTPESQTLFTDPRYTIQAAEECTCEVKIVTKTPLDHAALQTVRRKRTKRVTDLKPRGCCSKCTSASRNPCHAE